MKKNFKDVNWRSVRDVGELKNTPGWAWLMEARYYLHYRGWHPQIVDEFLGLYVPDKVAVFLFRVQIDPSFEERVEMDEYIWVLVGRIPKLYIVTDLAPTPQVALGLYCDLAADWIDDITHKVVPEELPDFSVDGLSDQTVAAELAVRIADLRKIAQLPVAQSKHPCVPFPHSSRRELRPPILYPSIDISDLHCEDEIKFACLHDIHAGISEKRFSPAKLIALRQYALPESFSLSGDHYDLKVLSGLTSIHRLSLSGQCGRFEDFTIFPELKSLGITINSTAGQKIRSDSLKRMSIRKDDNIKGMVSIDLSESINVDDIDLWDKTISVKYPPRLRRLWCKRGLKNGLADLAGNDTLEELEIQDGTLNTLDGIEKLPKLRHLRVEELSKLTDISALSRTKLDSLIIDHCNAVKDLSPVAGLPLRRFSYFTGKLLPDLSFLKTMKDLQFVSFAGRNGNQSFDYLADLPFFSSDAKMSYEREAKNCDYNYQESQGKLDVRLWIEKPWPVENGRCQP